MIWNQESGEFSSSLAPATTSQPGESLGQFLYKMEQCIHAKAHVPGLYDPGLSPTLKVLVSEEKIMELTALEPQSQERTRNNPIFLICSHLPVHRTKQDQHLSTTEDLIVLYYEDPAGLPDLKPNMIAPYTFPQIK